jgi:glutathione S-transferase
MSKPTLVYFAARGRAELIRLVLAEAGVDYHEHPVGRGTPPSDGRPTDLETLQASGELPFGAVPLWEEPDGFRLAQSQAIAEYLAATHGLRGSSAREAAQCDQMLEAVNDVRAELRKILSAAPDARPAVRESLLSSTLPRWFGWLDRLLRTNRGGEGFVVADAMSIADVALYYIVELARDNGFGKAFEPYAALTSFADRMARRPRLAAYVASPKRHPFVPFPR